MGQVQSPPGFIRQMNQHPIVETGLLGIARVKLVVGELASVGTAPCFGAESFQYTRPTAVGALEAVRVQTGKKVGDGAPLTPRADRSGSRPRP